jgi:hypothetical protein
MARAVRTLHTENHLPFGAPPQLVEGAPATLLHFDVDAADGEVEVLRLRSTPTVYVDGALVRDAGRPR